MRQQYTAQVLMVLAAGLMAACNDSSDNGETSETTDDTVSGSSPLQPIAGAENRFLFFTKESRIDNSAGMQPAYLFGVNAATGDRVMATPGPQNNAAERGENNEAFRVPLTQNRPDPSTLPLAVKTGDYQPTGAIENLRFEYVVYNTPDGELYRAATAPSDNGELNVTRISSEKDAEVVCAANVLPDFENPDLSVIVYQAAADGTSCDVTSWRMVRLHQPVDQEPAVLRASVEYKDGFTPPVNFIPAAGEPIRGLREHWTFAMRSTQGELTGILTFDGDDAETLEWHDAGRPEITETIIPNIDTWVRPLGIAGASGKKIIQANGLVYALSEQGEGNERLINMNSAETVGTNEETVDFSLTGPDQAVNLEGTLYVVDAVDGSHDTGRVLAIDPDRTDEQVEILANDGWGTGFIISNVTGSSDDRGFLSWAYRPGDCDANHCQGAIRSLDLTSKTSQDAKSDIEYDFPYRIRSSAAPNAATPLVFFEDTVPNAIGATSLSGLVDEYTINPANWLGQSWSRNQPSAGKLASHVYFSEGVANEFGGISYVIKSRPAQNVQSIEDVTFDQSPTQNSESEVSVQGYGSTVFFSFLLRDGIQSYSSVWIGDAEQPESLQPVVDDSNFMARPVPYF